MPDLLLRFGPGLEVGLLDQPETVLDAVRRQFRHQVVGGEALVARFPVERRERTGFGHTEPVLVEGPVQVRRAGPVTLFEAPGASAVCDSEHGIASIAVTEQTPALDTFVRVALGSIVLEMALADGWLGLHAAAVAADGRGVLLPGVSGSGKTTLFCSAHRAGLDVLSDDIVWAREDAGRFELRPFRRGVVEQPVPAPTLEQVPLTAIVCPTIVPGRPSRLQPLATREALEVLLAAAGFLAWGSAAARRFQAVVRLSAAVPAWRLLAGPGRDRGPDLLRLAAASAAR